MEEFILLKRTKKFNYKKMAIEPLFKLSNNGRFHLSKQAANILKVNVNDNILFSLSSNKNIYIFKSEFQDSFTLRKRTKEDMFNFTSKELGKHFIKNYNIKEFPAYFEFGDLKINKDLFMYPLILI